MHALDVIRCLAILLVVAHHVSFSFAPAPSDFIARFFRSAGWAGVDIFFALSGYLIAKILLSSTGLARASVKRFFIRRFFRIIPLYLVALFTFIAASLWVGGESLSGIWITALMLNGWFIPFFGVENVPFTITWSISVEEFAYALVALGCFPLRWSNRLAVLMIAVVLFGLLLVFTWLPRANVFYPLVGYAAFGIACASLVGAVSQQSWGKPAWLAGSLAWIGQVSYFLYLFHMFVIAFVHRADEALPWVELSYWPALAVVLALSSLAAWLSWRIFESPMIALGRRLTP